MLPDDKPEVTPCAEDTCNRSGDDSTLAPAAATNEVSPEGAGACSNAYDASGADGALGCSAGITGFTAPVPTAIEGATGSAFTKLAAVPYLCGAKLPPPRVGGGSTSSIVCLGTKFARGS